MFDYMGAISFAQWCCPCGQRHHQKVFKTITWLLLSRLSGNKPHRNSGTFWNLPPCLQNLLPQLASGTYTSPHRNSPEPSTNSRTHTSTHRNPPEPSGTCLRNLPPELASATCLLHLHQPTPELSGNFHNLPELTPAHTGTLRNLPEFASAIQNLHQHTGTLRNLAPEPTPAQTETLQNLPELPSEHASATCLLNLHQPTPELSGNFYNLPEPTPAPALWCTGVADGFGPDADS